MQRADKTIGGLNYRLMGLWKHLYDTQSSGKVLLLTNKTLWDKIFPGEDYRSYKGVYRFDDTKFYKLKAALISLYILFIILKNRVKSVHTAGAWFLLPVHKLQRLLGYRTCVTFGSASLDMAAHNNPQARKQWDLVLRNVPNLDILNPIHDLPNYGFRKFVSPCSFPFFLLVNKGRNFDYEQPVRNNDVMFIGNIGENKNPIFAFKGFEAFLRQNLTDYSLAAERPRLIFFGKGALTDQLTALRTTLNNAVGYEAVVHEKDDKLIFDRLSRSKVFLSLQEYDNYPSQSLMEAMLFCNSVIATDIGDTQRMVKKENGNILIHDDKVVEELADAIHASLKSYNLNVNNRNFILNNHNVERFAEYFIKMHTEILESK